MNCEATTSFASGSPLRAVEEKEQRSKYVKRGGHAVAPRRDSGKLRGQNATFVVILDNIPQIHLATQLNSIEPARIIQATGGVSPSLFFSCVQIRSSTNAGSFCHMPGQGLHTKKIGSGSIGIGDCSSHYQTDGIEPESVCHVVRWMRNPLLASSRSGHWTMALCESGSWTGRPVTLTSSPVFLIGGLLNRGCCIRKRTKKRMCK